MQGGTGLLLQWPFEVLTIWTSDMTPTAQVVVPYQLPTGGIHGVSLRLVRGGSEVGEPKLPFFPYCYFFEMIKVYQLGTALFTSLSLFLSQAQEGSPFRWSL